MKQKTDSPRRERAIGWEAIAELAEVHPATVRRAVRRPADHPLKHLVMRDPITGKPFVYLDEFAAMKAQEQPYHVKPGGRK